MERERERMKVKEIEREREIIPLYNTLLVMHVINVCIKLNCIHLAGN